MFQKKYTQMIPGILLGVCMSFMSAPAFASDDLEVAGWMPYWRDGEAMKDARKHIGSIDTLYPFAFTVKLDGSLKDNAGLSDRDWKSFLSFARSKNVEIMPTIMWSDTERIHTVLSDPDLRAHHIKTIVSMVEKGKYSGVDIDYENKKSETKDAFSTFLRELDAALGSKILSCTIEARTPPESLYREIPPVINYVNDYTVLNEVCDRIVIMAYDQQRADLLLNKKKTGAPYIPVADVDWVEKVVILALKSFPKDKIVLGIPSYGHHWDLTVAPDWFRDYRKVGALNVPDMKDLAKEYKVTPTRNSAGEMSFTYLSKAVDSKVARQIKAQSIPKNTPKGDQIAQKALAYANKTGNEVVVRVGWYSDGGAMIDKVKLAERYGLRGVSLFKIDGEEDQSVWTYLKK